jgi:hypothetical protein
MDIPELDTSETTNMQYMFTNCGNLINIPQLNTSKVEYMRDMFGACAKLQNVQQLDASKVKTVVDIFSMCSELVTCGGLKDLGKSYTSKTANAYVYKFSVEDCKKLTHESLLNIINNLYDLNIAYGVYDEEGQAGTGTLYTQSLILGTTNIAKLTDEEIAIATTKGWTVS